MNRIKYELRRIKNYLFFLKKIRMPIKKQEKKIFYFGITMHNNLGDQAQKYCIRKWLSKYYPERFVYEIPSRIIYDERFHYLEHLKKVVQPDDMFVFQSGYCTLDLGPAFEDKMHRMVIQAFPNQKMLMFPQTVYYQKEENRQRAIREYNIAKHMLFLARDHISYESARSMFDKLKVELFPDIVTSLIGTFSFDFHREGILVCARNDAEKFYTSQDLDKLIVHLSQKYHVDCTDTTLPIDPYWLDHNLEDRLITEFAKYARYKLIITDRYHGTIFSLIAGTPVIVIKTNDHKVTTGVDWFKGIYDGYVYLAEDLDSVRLLTDQIICKTFTHSLTPYFNEKYYSKLKEVFEDVTI